MFGNEENINSNNDEIDVLLPSDERKRLFTELDFDDDNEIEESDLGCLATSSTQNELRTTQTASIPDIRTVVGSHDKPQTEEQFCLCFKVYEGENMIACENADGCRHPYAKGWFHPKCVDLSDLDYIKISEKNLEWKCKWCIKN